MKLTVFSNSLLLMILIKAIHIKYYMTKLQSPILKLIFQHVFIRTTIRLKYIHKEL